MPPVGNDVVDLSEPGNGGKHRDGRFLQRVFTDDERRRIAVAHHPDRLLWSLWAAKEAAYKVFSRSDPGVGSVPRHYAVTIEGEAAFADPTVSLPLILGGRVIAPSGEAALRLRVAEAYVHLLAAGAHADMDGLVERVVPFADAADPAEPSLRVRCLLLAEIAETLAVPVETLSVRKDEEGPGAPSVFLGDALLTEGISLSHDGRFVAYAFDAATLKKKADRFRPAPCDVPSPISSSLPSIR